MGAPTVVSLPDSRLLDALAALYLRAPTRAALDAVGDDPRFAVSGGRLDDVVADYHALFFVPVSGRYVAPFESAQRGLPLGGTLPQHIGRLYEAGGFEPQELLFDDRWGRAPRPDHVGCELAFVAALQRDAALRAGQRGAALLETAAAFWSQHPATWLGDFGRAVAAAAGTSLYRRAGQLIAEMGGSPDPSLPREHEGDSGSRSRRAPRRGGRRRAG